MRPPKKFSPLTVNKDIVLNVAAKASHEDHVMKRLERLCGTKGYEVLQKDEDEDAIVTGSQYGLYAVSSAVIFVCSRAI